MAPAGKLGQLVVTVTEGQYVVGARVPLRLPSDTVPAVAGSEKLAKVGFACDTLTSTRPLT